MVKRALTPACVDSIFHQKLPWIDFILLNTFIPVRNGLNLTSLEIFIKKTLLFEPYGTGILFITKAFFVNEPKIKSIIFNSNCKKKTLIILNNNNPLYLKCVEYFPHLWHFSVTSFPCIVPQWLSFLLLESFGHTYLVLPFSFCYTQMISFTWKRNLQNFRYYSSLMRPFWSHMLIFNTRGSKKPELLTSVPYVYI